MGRQDGAAPGDPSDDRGPAQQPRRQPAARWFASRDHGRRRRARQGAGFPRMVVRSRECVPHLEHLEGEPNAPEKSQVISPRLHKCRNAQTAAADRHKNVRVVPRAGPNGLERVPRHRATKASQCVAAGLPDASPRSGCATHTHKYAHQRSHSASSASRISDLVAEYVVAIDVPRVRSRLKERFRPGDDNDWVALIDRLTDAMAH